MTFYLQWIVVGFTASVLGLLLTGAMAAGIGSVVAFVRALRA